MQNLVKTVKWKSIGRTT